MNYLKITAAVILLGASLTYGQTSQGTIAGTITDPTGAAMVNAEVTARNTLGSDVRTVKTGPHGEYRIDAVTPSTYLLTITSPGFTTKEVKNILVTASVVTSVNTQLEVGNTTQTVEVQAATSAIQTESGELSYNISTHDIVQMPIPTGNPIDLVLTKPGIVTVSSNDNFGNGENFAANGLRARGNNFLIDGFDNNDYGITGQALQPGNLESIKEVAVQTNSYSAEFGRGGSTVTNVIYKNGTNQYHGTAWERYDASFITAIPVELQRTGIKVEPQFVDNEFGFDLGGPVIKNKLFLFGSSQWDHKNEDETGGQIFIPTAAGVASLRSLNNPNANLLIQSLSGLTAATSSGAPLNAGNRPGCGNRCLIDVGPEIRTVKGQNRNYEYIVRGDYVASEKDTVSARFIGAQNSLTPDFFANPDALPGQDTQQGGPSRTLGVYWTHVFNPTQVNEARFTAQNINFSFAPLASTVANPLFADPNLTITGFDNASFGGLGPGFPQARGHNVYEYQDAFSWTIGTHSFKIGADLVHLGVNDTIPFNSRGTVAYQDCKAVTDCTALSNFLDDFTGPAGTVGKQFGNPFLSLPQTLQGYYFQDTWKMRPNVTLNYGVRYEYQGTPLNALPFPAIQANSAGLFAPLATRTLEQPDKNNFGPRAGLAYTPRFWKEFFGEDKTVFRAGFGAFYDVLFTNITDNSASTAPNALGGTITAPGTGRGLSGALEQVGAFQPILNPLATIDTVSSNLVNPLTYQWNFDIERQLPGDMLLTLAYVGTRGERLFVNQELNPGIDNARINPDKGSITNRSNLGDSIYHALDVNVEHKFRHGIQITGAYTYSKVLDTGSDVFTSSGLSSFPQDEFNYGLDRGPAAFDVRHRGVISFDYQTPNWKSSSSFATKALSWAARNWEFTGITSFQTGVPYTVSVGSDNNGDLRGGNDRPSAGSPSAPINYTAACIAPGSGCITGIGTFSSGGQLVDINSGAPGNPSQFRYIVPGALGNLARNSLYNPGRWDMDLALTRVIKLPWEGHQLEFRLESQNALNHPNAGGGTSQDGSNVPGIAGDIASPGTFLNKDITFEGGRSVLLWMKYRF